MESWKGPLAVLYVKVVGRKKIGISHPGLNGLGTRALPRTTAAISLVKVN